MNQTSEKRTSWRRVGRITARILLGILGLFVFLFLFVQLPAVQNVVRKKTVAYLERKLQTKVEVGELRVGLNKLSLGKIYLEDRNQDTLLAGGEVTVNINLLRLLLSNQLDISSIRLSNVTARIARSIPDSGFNYQFVLDAFAPKSDGSRDTGSVSYVIPKVQLENISFRYKDTVTGLFTEGFLESLDTRIDALDPVKQDYIFEKTNIRNLHAKLYQSKPIDIPDIPDTLNIIPAVLDLQLGQTHLEDVQLDFRNDVSRVYSDIKIGTLDLETDLLDVANMEIVANELSLHNSQIAFRFGNTASAQEARREVTKEVSEEVKKGWRIRANKLDLLNNQFSIENEARPRQRVGIDYAHMNVEDLDLDVDNFIFVNDSIGGRINHASFSEQSGFQLDELRGDVLYSGTGILLNDLYLRTPGTELKRFFRMDYASPAALSRDFPSTEMSVNIDESRVKVGDILAFAPALARQKAFSNPNDTWFLDLQGRGTLRSMHIDNLRFDGFSDTQIDAQGSLSMTGGSQSGGTLHIRRLHTNQTDIALLTGRRLSQRNLRLPEELTASGTLSGGADRINADLAIATSLGNLDVRGEFSNLSNPAAARYDAEIATRGLQMGQLTGNPQLGALSGVFHVNGSGFTANSMRTDFRSDIHSLTYNGYTYRSARAEGTMNGSLLQVNADIDDPNLAIHGQLTAVLSGGGFRFDGFADSIKLQPLGFSKNPVTFRGKVVADIPSLSAEAFNADITVTEGVLVSASQRLPLDSVQFTARKTDSIQYLSLRSPIAKADVQGQFRVSELGAIINHAIRPYFKTSSNISSPSLPYSVSFTADVNNAPILADLVSGLDAFEPIHLEGSIDNITGLNARANTASLQFNGNTIHGLQLNVQTTANGLAFNSTFSRLKSKTFDLYTTRLSGIASNNQIDFRLGVDDAAGRPRYLLSGLVSQPSTGQYALNLKPDSLLLNYQSWSVSPNNSLLISKSHIAANNFTLSRGSETISLQSAGEVLNANFSNFQLSTITAFMRSDSTIANGRMNGTVGFRNILTQPVFTSDLQVADLSIRGDTLGNANIKVDNLGGEYRANATISGRGNDVSLTGSFAPLANNDIGLDLHLAIRQLQLSTIDGPLGGFVKNSSGSIDGNISIGGSINSPRINGPINFNNASFALNILGSQFRIDNQELVFTERGFIFEDFIIRDTANNVLRLDGTVGTSDFTDYDFNVDVRADNFKLLNTTKKDNKIYYGELVISSEMHVDGTSEKPVIDGSLTVNDGTRLFIVIPQREPGVIAREGIVEFVNMEHPEIDTLFRAYHSLSITPFVGMDVAANIEIRKEAVFNIVIDEANGDFLNLQGEALLTSGIDPSGKITLIGSYELDRGAYEISFNFLRRRFEIDKGSSIQWFGEPTRANLNVTAVYVANTSPIDLVHDQIDAATPAIRNTYLQKLPFEVRLTLTGEMLQPNIAFDITLPQNRTFGVSNDIITQVESRLSQLRSDPGEINKQVFALLLMNRFVGENPLASSSDFFSGSTYLRQSVSRVLTDQLNQLAAGLIDGVDLTFDVTTTEDYTTGQRRSRTDLNIGLSKQLLNERLQVSIGTNFELEGSRPTNEGAGTGSSAIGNIAVDYAISRDRRYLIRFYRKNEYQGVVDGYVIETGMSFIISVDYEKFRELLRRRKNQKIEGVK